MVVHPSISIYIYIYFTKYFYEPIDCLLLAGSGTSVVAMIQNRSTTNAASEFPRDLVSIQNHQIEMFLSVRTKKCYGYAKCGGEKERGEQKSVPNGEV